MELENTALSAPRGSIKPKECPSIESSPARRADGCEAKSITHSVVSKTVESRNNWNGRKRGPRQVSPFCKEKTPFKKRRRPVNNDAVRICNLPPKLNSIGFCSFVQKTMQEMHGEKVEVSMCQRLYSNDGGKLSVLISFENADHCFMALSLNGVEYMGRSLHATLDNPDSEERTRRLEKSKERLRRGEGNERQNNMDAKRDYLKMKRLLEEAQNDIRYLRQQLESENSYSRRMECSLDDLRHENDDLRRRSHDTDKMKDELDALLRENENLRLQHRDSKRLEHELDGLRRENDDLRMRYHADTRHAEYDRRGHGYDDREYTANLRWQLGELATERDSLVRDTERLKGQILDLKSSNAYLKRENEYSSGKSNRRHKEEDNASPPLIKPDNELQRRLDEALSQNELLNSILKQSKQKVKGLEEQNESINSVIIGMRTENELLQEEMEQMRMNRAMELGFAEAGDGGQ